MKKNKKKIPQFSSEKEEMEFWLEHDSEEFVEWDKAKQVSFPNLKPSTKTISLRLPETILDELKILAHKRDVPYQSLIKVFLKDRIDLEFGHA